MLSWLCTLYIMIAVYTYWVDSTALYKAGYSEWSAIVVGLFDGLIWPVRWGWDLIVLLINKNKKGK